MLWEFENKVVRKSSPVQWFVSEFNLEFVIWKSTPKGNYSHFPKLKFPVLAIVVSHKIYRMLLETLPGDYKQTLMHSRTNIGAIFHFPSNIESE